MKTQFRHCKLCQRPIFRNEVEVIKEGSKRNEIIGRFHNHCSTKYINKHMKRKPHRHKRPFAPKTKKFLLSIVVTLKLHLYKDFDSQTLQSNNPAIN